MVTSTPEECAEKARGRLCPTMLEADAYATISDAICNLIHLAEKLGENPIRVAANGLGHWAAERDDPDGPPWRADIELSLGRRELTEASFDPPTSAVKWIS